MKITLQILLITITLFIQKTTFATAYFNASLSNKISIHKEKNVKETIFKNWQKPTKTKRIKHGERWFLGGILALTGLFAGLKIAKIIAWSWLWIVSPIWITAALLILLFIYVIILFLIIGNNNEKIEATPN